MRYGFLANRVEISQEGVEPLPKTVVSRETPATGDRIPPASGLPSNVLHSRTLCLIRAGLGAGEDGFPCGFPRPPQDSHVQNPYQRGSKVSLELAFG